MASIETFLDVCKQKGIPCVTKNPEGDAAKAVPLKPIGLMVGEGRGRLILPFELIAKFSDESVTNFNGTNPNVLFESVTTGKEAGRFQWKRSYIYVPLDDE
jgi:hypothetical protein